MLREVSEALRGPVGEIPHWTVIEKDVRDYYVKTGLTSCAYVHKNGSDAVRVFRTR